MKKKLAATSGESGAAYKTDTADHVTTTTPTTTSKGLEPTTQIPLVTSGGTSTGSTDRDREDRTMAEDHWVSDRFWLSVRQWADVTTFHGIRNMFDEKTSIFRRGFWFLCILAFVAISMWFCHDQLNRYLSYKTLLEKVSHFPQTIHFPAVTICSYTQIRSDYVSDSSERKLLTHLYENHQSNETILAEEFGATFLNTVSLRRLFENGAETLDDIFRECSWGGNVINCSEWKKRTTSSGYCFTFNSDEEANSAAMLKVVRMTGKNYGLHLILATNETNSYLLEDGSVGFKVMIHKPSEYPDVDRAVSLAPGFTHYVAVTKHENVYLPLPVRAFGDRECFDKSATSFPGNYRNYTEYLCIQGCRVQYIYKQCDCVGPLDDESLPECSPLELVSCYNEAERNFSTYAEDCYCPVPCEVTEYTTSMSTAALAGKKEDPNRGDLVELYVYYENKVVVRHEQVLAMTFEQLWGNFGGMIGIAVGCSIVTFMEIAELFIMGGIHHIQSMRDFARDDPHAAI